jgi:hypothetical protein
MPRDPSPPTPGRTPKWSSAWRLLFTGLGLSIAGWLVLGSETALPVVFPLVSVFAGTTLLLLAVTRRLREETWDWPGRIESAALVSLAGLGALAGYAAMRKEWYSGLMFYGALFVLCLGGSLLILLPSLARRVALSLFVLFHFAGMVVCSTSIDPPNAQGPWLSKQLWTWVYRPYLSFLYLTNAYHFYSPDPGPPALLWFAVHYDDGTYTWVKMPERSNSPVGMHYQRHLALPEHAFGALNRLPLSAAEIQALKRLGKEPPEDSWENIYLRREQGSTLRFGPKRLQIPMLLDMDALYQYREPNELSKKMIRSVARRALQLAPPARDAYGNVKENVRPVTVKVYRVVHQILTPYELAEGVSPLDKPKHWPYFLGEFDAEGHLLNVKGRPLDEKTEPHLKDPFLYWYLPILRVPSDYPDHGVRVRMDVPAIRAREAAPKDSFLLDGLELHAAGRSRPAAEENK